jgi:hypothetical protein
LVFGNYACEDFPDGCFYLADVRVCPTPLPELGNRLRQYPKRGVSAVAAGEAVLDRSPNRTFRLVWQDTVRRGKEIARFRTLQALCREIKSAAVEHANVVPVCYVSGETIHKGSTMKVWQRFFFLFVVALFATDAARGDENSPFMGSYSGKFTFRSSNPNFPNGEGMVRSLNVAANGKITGTFNPPNGELGEFNGSVDEEGSMSYTVQFTNQTYVVKGLVVKTKRGSLKGSATQYAGRNAVGSVEFDLLPK